MKQYDLYQLALRMRDNADFSFARDSPYVMHFTIIEWHSLKQKSLSSTYHWEQHKHALIAREKSTITLKAT